eukprot:jgi/Tetstr1/453805/TSEL_040756.t1
MQLPAFLLPCEAAGWVTTPADRTCEVVLLICKQPLELAASSHAILAARPATAHYSTPTTRVLAAHTPIAAGA